MKQGNRVAIYTRVSTDDGKQTAENQTRELREFCDREGYTIVAEFTDNESGRKGRRARKEFGDMFKSAGRREFDLLLFWSLDRLTREGIRQTISYLQILDTFDVQFRSYTEPYLNTADPLIAHILIGVNAHYAEYEAKRISERTKAGLKRARAQGKILGAPAKFERYRDELLRMKNEGASKKGMARETGLSINSVRKYLKMLEEEGSVI